MQTFLPYPNFAVSAMCLDYRRLGKQRVETRQIQTFIQETRARQFLPDKTTPDKFLAAARLAAAEVAEERGKRINTHFCHPATVAWRDHVEALMLYGDCMIREWVRRGYNNTMPLMCSRDTDDLSFGDRDITMPEWLGDDRIHSSHRASLLIKDRIHYGQLGWSETPEYNYVWPAETEK